MADIFIIIGTSLQVYPAAGLIDFVPVTALKFIIDLNETSVPGDIESIKESASTGVPKLVDRLLKSKT
jgi:NAD-dependent deacetylase